VGGGGVRGGREMAERRRRGEKERAVRET